jgi:putative transposase
MPRIARLILPGYPYHITQRGNYRQKIFKDDQDRQLYLGMVAEYSIKHGVLILAYCLMNNHVHFIAIPQAKDSFAKTFSITHTRYAQYFNKKMELLGHLWQGRFYSCILDENHLVAAARYVERNPVRAGIVKNPIEYEWSSVRGHIDNSSVGLIETDSLFKYIEVEQTKWKEFVSREDDSKTIMGIRKNTMTGRPLGSEAFVKKLENICGKRLHALSVGRPREKIGVCP